MLGVHAPKLRLGELHKHTSQQEARALAITRAGVDQVSRILDRAYVVLDLT
ncbi:hypothetical protein ACIQGZ_14395 [Streptomyces sp. NPDC092296]|uniref:hypothetical protein n=1 Tax=Streptomyces sp. NPDC092296 TaxID=3366012 RepID=UPI00382C303B